ncbi:MAG: hypothetical protein ACFE9Z_11520 [Promethearchaeota archaeon]
MKKVHKVVLFVIAACLVTGGSAVGVLVFTTWGTIDYENTYYYDPGVAASIERINIYTDIGSVFIKYNDTPTNYYAQVDLDIHIEGILVKDSNFSDFFYTPVWQNESSPITTFILDAKAPAWFYFGLFRQVDIILTLRTDIVYDINTLVGTGAITMNIAENAILNNTILESATGSIFLNSSKNVTFQADAQLSTSTGSIQLYAKKVNFSHNLLVSSSTGSLLLNFSSCTIGGDLVGSVATGSIDFNSYNMKYAGENIWNLHTSTGSIDVTILQYTEIGSNVTSSVSTSTGSIDVYYRDNSANVGAKFTCSTSTGSNSYNSIGSGGFSQSGGYPTLVITSDDYVSANNKYTLTVSTSTGSNGVAAESI